MPDLSLSQYVYVDTAFGSVTHRNHVRRIAEVPFDDHGPERYISHRRATEDLLVWTRSHTNANGNPTIEGFDGAVWDSSLAFDFDDKANPAHALGWLRDFLVRLETNEVPLDAPRYYFSGAKGFHLELPGTLFGGFQPSPDLHVWEKIAALELMGGIPFDQSIYDKLRLWRLTNTLNAKGNRFKVQLSLDEVRGLSMAEIAELATAPRPRLLSAPDADWATNPYLSEVWRRAQAPPVVAGEPAAVVWSDQRQNQVILSVLSAAVGEAWPALEPGVSRHTDYLLPLSGFLSRHLSVPEVAAVLKDAARRSGDRNFLDDRQRHWEDEIERLAQSSSDKIAAGQPAEGLPTIAQRWPELAEVLGNLLVVGVGSNRKSTNGSSHNGVTGFSFVVLEDLLAEPPEQVAFTVDGILPAAGVSLWAAKPKSGKSVAVRTLAMCVAHGEPFLGRAVEQGNVLVLALEEKRAEVANHFRQMGGTNEQIHIHTGAAPGSSKEGLAALQVAISLVQPTLVVVDPVLKLVRVRDSSDYAELTRELEPVIELARTNGCHVAVTHHLGKQLREGGDDVLGSTAIFGAVDTLVLIRRRKDNTRVLQTIQRYGADVPETLLPLDEVTGRIGLGTELSEVRVVEAQQAVRDLFSKLTDDEWLDQKTIRGEAGINSALAYKALQTMVETGEVERDGVGKHGNPYRYRLARFTPEPAPEQPVEPCFVVFPTSNEKQQNNKTGMEEGRLEEAAEDPRDDLIVWEDDAVETPAPIASEQPVEPCFVVFPTSNEKQQNKEEQQEIEVRATCQQCGREEAAHGPDDLVCGDWQPIWRGEI
jgi:hypothetical protein